MNIAIFEFKGDKKEFKNKINGSVKFFEGTIQQTDISKFKNSDIVSVFIYSRVTEEIIDKLPKLKAVVTRSTGYDHIDIDYCHEKGIQTANVPYYGENTVAEHTFALILNLSRMVHKSYVRTLKNNFTREGLTGFDLKGKTLGVIGVGHIGLHVIRIAKGFGMHVKAYDINKDQFISEVLHYNYTTLNDVLKNSDIISLHMPYNTKTHHFIDEKKLSMMKKGTIIINTSRGGLIDTKALYKYLKNKHVGGAGLDVIEGEELVGKEEELIISQKNRNKLRQVLMDKRIFNMENVIFTPHNAFNSLEAKERINNTAIDNINNYVKKGKVLNPV